MQAGAAPGRIDLAGQEENYALAYYDGSHHESFSCCSAKCHRATAGAEIDDEFALAGEPETCRRAEKSREPRFLRSFAIHSRSRQFADAQAVPVHDISADQCISVSCRA